MAIYNINGIDIEHSSYAISGSLLSQAYDIQANPLIDAEPTSRVVITPNQSSGTDSGYSFWLSNPGYAYPLYDVADFLSDSPDYQSFCYNSDSNVFYKFDTSTTVAVYNSSFVKTGTITLPSTAGHKNDACYYSGKIYFPGGEDLSGLYVWDIANNTVSEIAVSGIPSPTSAPKRISTAVCCVPDEPGYLYVVYTDFQNDATIHDPNDKLGIYKYNIATHEAVLIAEYQWDCVFVQGAEIKDGILYVACNSPTTVASSYTGITLKAFRTDDWTALPSLYLSAAIEPEGMCLYPYSDSGKTELMMGIGHYQTLAKATRFTAPYKLVTQ